MNWCCGTRSVSRTRLTNAQTFTSCKFGYILCVCEQAPTHSLALTFLTLFPRNKYRRAVPQTVPGCFLSMLCGRETRAQITKQNHLLLFTTNNNHPAKQCHKQKKNSYHHVQPECKTLRFHMSHILEKIYHKRTE